MASDIIDMVYDDLKKEIALLQVGQSNLHNATEQAGFTDNIPAATFANLPTSGLGTNSTYATVWFCSNGRKGGEGVGAGTGVPVYWNTATSQWLKFSDDLVVTV